MLYLSILFIAILKIHPSYTLVEKLPDSVVPKLYDLKLQIDTNGNNQYSGYVNIQVICKETTRTIVLHANVEQGLKLLDVRVQELFGKHEYILIKSLGYGDGNDFVYINLQANLSPEKEYEIEFEFMGTLDQSAGLVKSDLNGKFFVASNFQRTNARKVFPCFDEPSKKARFRLIIERRSEANSLSNADLETKAGSPNNEGWWLDTYYVTPLLSTYQVAFVVSEIEMSKSMEYKEHTSSPVTFSIQQSYENIAGSGSDLAFSGLHMLIDLIKLPKIVPEYLQKVDCVILPSAKEVRVESLGLTVIREYDFAIEALKGHDSLMHLIFEGMANQWFGGVLSPSWWDSQWLLDSLAKYIPLFILPQGYLNDVFLPEISLQVMIWDSEPDVRQVNNIFNSNGALEPENSIQKLSKGMMLLRMVNRIIGDGPFIQGVEKFTSNFLTKSVSADNFWEVIDQFSSRTYTSGIPIRFLQKTTTVELIPKSIGTKNFMKSWTDQAGYPIIYVKRSETDVKVSQERFYNDKDDEAKNTETQCWWIPLTYTTAANPNEFKDTEPKQWLGCDTKFPATATLKNVVKKNHWIIFNNRISGLYRVNYDREGWELILAELKNPKTFSKIDTLNRALLVNDAFALYYTGDLDTELIVQLLSYLRHETNLVLWKSYFNNFERLMNSLKRSPIFNDYKIFMKVILSKVYETIFPKKDEALKYINGNTNVEDMIVKMYIHMNSCEVKVPKCVSQSKEIFQQWQKKGFNMEETLNDFPVALVLSTICTVLNEPKNVKETDFIISKIDDPQVKNMHRRVFIESLRCVNSKPAIKKVLDWCTSTTYKENFEEKITVFSKMLTFRTTLPEALQYFYLNFDNINMYFSKLASPGTPNPMKFLILKMACEMNTEEIIKLKAFIRSNTALRTLIVLDDLKECELLAEINGQWLNKNADSIKAALNKETEKKSGFFSFFK